MKKSKKNVRISAPLVVHQNNVSHVQSLLKTRGGILLIAQPGIYSSEENGVVDAMFNVYMHPSLDVQRCFVSSKTASAVVVGTVRQEVEDGLEYLLRYLPRQQRDVSWQKRDRKFQQPSSFTKNAIQAFDVTPAFCFQIGTRTISGRTIHWSHDVVLYVKNSRGLPQAFSYALGRMFAAINHTLAQRDEDVTRLTENHVQQVVSRVVAYHEQMGSWANATTSH